MLGCHDKHELLLTSSTKSSDCLLTATNNHGIEVAKRFLYICRITIELLVFLKPRAALANDHEQSRKLVKVGGEIGCNLREKNCQSSLRGIGLFLIYQPAGRA